MHRIHSAAVGFVLGGALLAACGSSKSEPNAPNSGGAAGNAPNGGGGTAGNAPNGGGGTAGNAPNGGGAGGNVDAAGQANGEPAGANAGGEAGMTDCAVGDGHCVGQAFERCGPDNRWQSGSVCKFVCDPSDGCMGTCAPGTLKCQGSAELDQCSNKGAFEKAEACDLVCAVVKGQAECVGCTSGDGLCVGGCTPPEDSDCPPEVGGSSCPNVYFGVGRYKSPQPRDFANTSIGSPATLTLGKAILVPVEVYNHGDASPPLSIELLWGDPTDGCRAKDDHLIGSAVFAGGITGASTLPPVDGVDSASFGWKPEQAALNTNGGHVCLLARLKFLTPPAKAGCTQQIYNTENPATDPRSAVRNVQIVVAQ